MSHILLFDDQRQWFAANWAARHLVDLILQFLPNKDSRHIGECLGHINDFPGCNVDLTTLDLRELRVLHAAAERALAALKQAGPNSEYFKEPAFFPGFVSKFEEFTQVLNGKIRTLDETKG
jgi:hypothetical protein